MTLEEFDAWCAATDRHEKMAESADEGGGPRLSLVPVPEQNIAWPTDLLPAAFRKTALLRPSRWPSTG